MVDNNYEERMEKARENTLDLVSEAYVNRLSSAVDDYLLKRVESAKDLEGLGKVVADFSRGMEGFTPEKLFELHFYEVGKPNKEIPFTVERKYESFSDFYTDFKQRTRYNNRELSEIMKTSFRSLARLSKNAAPENYPHLSPRQIESDRRVKQRILDAFDFNPPEARDEIESLPWHHGYEPSTKEED